MDGDDLLGFVSCFPFMFWSFLEEFDEESWEEEDYVAIVDGKLHLDKAIQVGFIDQLHLHFLLALTVSLETF